MSGGGDRRGGGGGKNKYRHEDTHKNTHTLTHAYKTGFLWSPFTKSTHKDLVDPGLYWKTQGAKKEDLTQNHLVNNSYNE